MTKRESMREDCTQDARPPIRGPRVEIERGESLYPPALESVASPPNRLYVLGNPDALSEGLAVVGARKATPYGLGCAHRFARAAAERGIVIVSGGARGCDAAAHKAALEVGGRTVAFLGGGCDKVYPAEHRGLFQNIVDAGGALVSEHPWDFPPVPYAFRARNRLIAGLSRATLIVEAGLPSGTFSTADEALSAGREVFVVPGAITSASSRGANRLLYQGAVPIVDDESFQDALFSVFGLLKQEVAPVVPNVGHPSDGVLADAPLGVGDVDASFGIGGSGASLGVGDAGISSGVGGGSVPSGSGTGGGKGDVAPLPVALGSGNEVLEALLAEPMNLEELYLAARRMHPEGDARAWLMERLAEAEAMGTVARYPDGRWGPAIRLR